MGLLVSPTALWGLRGALTPLHWGPAHIWARSNNLLCFSPLHHSWVLWPGPLQHLVLPRGLRTLGTTATSFNQLLEFNIASITTANRISGKINWLPGLPALLSIHCTHWSNRGASHRQLEGNGLYYVLVRGRELNYLRSTLITPNWGLQKFKKDSLFFFFWTRPQISSFLLPLC